MKIKRTIAKRKKQLSEHDAILKLLVEFQRTILGVPLKDFLAVAKRKGIEKRKASTILKKLESQKRIKIEKSPVIYPGENYYVWHEKWD